VHVWALCFILLEIKLSIRVLSDDLKWNNQIDIISKASKCLYCLRLMKRAGAKPSVILKIYKSTVRPILEYAVQVWQNIPGYLSDRVETMRHSCLQRSLYWLIEGECCVEN
jgi:hypothetical protein